MKLLLLLLVPALAFGAYQLEFELAGVPPATVPAVREAAVTPVGANVSKDILARLPALSVNSQKRKAERLTLRVRNTSCAGVSRGSAFAIDSHTLITNRHVLAGAAILELNTWDGHSLDINVDSAVVAELVDIGVATTRAALPQTVAQGPAAKVGDKVTAVGYPLGGELTLSPGRVLGYVDGRNLHPSIAINGSVMKLSVKIKHGNSGGPVLDARGRVVAVIYAGEPGATYESYARVAYAIPMKTFRALVKSGGYRPVLPCQE